MQCNKQTNGASQSTITNLFPIHLDKSFWVPSRLNHPQIRVHLAVDAVLTDRKNQVVLNMSYGEHEYKTQTRKIAPSFLPMRMLAPTRVMVSSAIPQTPMAEAMYGPSPRRLKNSKMALVIGK